MLLFYEQNNISVVMEIFITQFEFAVNTYFSKEKIQLQQSVNVMRVLAGNSTAVLRCNTANSSLTIDGKI